MARVSKEANSSYFRKWYNDNKDTQYSRIKKRQAEIRAWLVEYKKGLSCKICGETHPACLDFHHRNPDEKEGSVSNIVSTRGWGLARIKQEIEKCDVICANCHRKLHWEENNI